MLLGRHKTGEKCPWGRSFVCVFSTCKLVHVACTKPLTSVFYKNSNERQQPMHERLLSQPRHSESEYLDIDAGPISGITTVHYQASSIIGLVSAAKWDLGISMTGPESYQTRFDDDHEDSHPHRPIFLIRLSLRSIALNFECSKCHQIPRNIPPKEQRKIRPSRLL